MADHVIEHEVAQPHKSAPATLETLVDPETADLSDDGSGQQAGRGASGMPRYITVLSTINFTCIILLSWEAFAVTFQFALYNGGPASMIYGCVLVLFGVTAATFSLAELASIDPVVGAQYRWSSSLAPAYGKFFGLLQGWITVFAWLAASLGSPAINSQIITALVEFNYPGYVNRNWHTMLIMWPLIIIPFVLNLWVRKILNVWESVGGGLHFVAFFIYIAVLLALAKRSPNEFVWETLTVGQSGWENPALNFNLGLLTLTFSVCGFDAILHMSDEAKRVEVSVPRSMIIATTSNVVMLFAFVLILLYCIGDLDAVYTDNPRLPLITVFYQATKSKGGTTVLVALPALVIFFTSFNAYASVSRLIWSFAKDNGLPFSPVFSHISPRYGVPVNALILISVFSMILSIIYVFSTTAFNALISLQALALNVSYILPILFVLIRRLTGKPPPYGPFALGRWGIPVNALGLAYLIYIVIWMPFPTTLPVTGTNFNYAGPILGFVIVVALADFAISGRKRFRIPTRGALTQTGKVQ